MAPSQGFDSGHPADWQTVSHILTLMKTRHHCVLFENIFIDKLFGICLQVNTPVTLPSSVTSLLQNCPRLSPHFTFTPTTADEEQTTPLTPPLAEFVNINPFEVSSRTKELGPPKSHTTAEEGGNDGCCEPPAAKRPCCESGTAVEGGRGTAAENGSGTCCAAACGDTCGTEKSCC